jgi:hypothetical protein
LGRTSNDAAGTRLMPALKRNPQKLIPSLTMLHSPNFTTRGMKKEHYVKKTQTIAQLEDLIL